MRFGRRGRILPAAAVAVAAALAFTSCAASSEPAGAPEPGELRTVKVSAPPSYNALTLHVAEAEGYFEEVGIKLELSTVIGGEAVPALIGGNLDFILNDMVTLITARSKGLPLVIATPNVLLDAPAESAYVEILMRKEDEAKYTTAADIAGQTFGIPTVNSQPWVDVRTLVADAGGDPETIEFVQVPDPMQALREKQVDFVTAPNPMATAAKLSGDLASLTPVTTEELGGVIGYPYLTTEQLVESDPDLVADFRAAVIKANKLINSDPERAYEIAATYIDLPEDVLTASTLPHLGEAMPTAEDVQKSIDRIVANGIIDAAAAPAPADLIAK